MDFRHSCQGEAILRRDRAIFGKTKETLQDILVFVHLSGRNVTIASEWNKTPFLGRQVRFEKRYQPVSAGINPDVDGNIKVFVPGIVKAVASDG